MIATDFRHLLTALISSLRATETGDLRASLSLAGRSVLSWQVDTALSLGCERIICLCEGPAEHILAAQREVERAGQEFHAIRSNIQIAALVRADDEIVLFSDGLLISKQAAGEFVLEAGKRQRGIATLPANHVLAEHHPEDFERIDRDRHWAGLALIRARQVKELAELPPDGDATSLLLRLALQAQEPCRPVKESWLQGDDWLLAVDAADLANVERALVGENLPAPSPFAPIGALAIFAARAIPPGNIGLSGKLAAVAAIALWLGAMVLVLAGWPASALACGAIAVFAADVFVMVHDLRSRLDSVEPARMWHSAVSGVVFGGTTALLMLAPGIGSVAASQLGLPVIALGLAIVCSRASKLRHAAFWNDRALHLAFFAVAAGTGLQNEALVAFSFAATLQLLLQRGD